MKNNILILIKGFIKTIFFNFHYLPLQQAIKLPIWLYNVKLKSIKGKITIDSEVITPGMIKLGPRIVSLYETTTTRFVWELRGRCCFKGTCLIGHNSAISTGKKGYLEFGNNFIVTSTLRIACYKSIIFGENTRMSWENVIIDTDFHETINIHNGKRSIPCKEIKIGKNNWIGFRSVILKGAETPDFCIIGANSLLNFRLNVPSYSVVAGNPAKLVKEGIYRDLESYIE